jgi:osmotically-inducible protein OsmY
MQWQRFISLAVMSLVLGCGATEDRKSTGEAIDDAVIVTKARALLIKESPLKYQRVVIESDRGAVRLSGPVDSKDGIGRAAEIVGGVVGVRKVTNEITLDAAK